MTKHPLGFLLLLCVISAGLCNNLLAQTGGERSAAIEGTYPVLDQIGKAYAEKNHFPGFTGLNSLVKAMDFSPRL
jgi:hypothetical protein